jgi:hypothetical protein
MFGSSSLGTKHLFGTDIEQCRAGQVLAAIANHHHR